MNVVKSFKCLHSQVGDRQSNNNTLRKTIPTLYISYNIKLYGIRSSIEHLAIILDLKDEKFITEKKEVDIRNGARCSRYKCFVREREREKRKNLLKVSRCLSVREQLNFAKARTIFLFCHRAYTCLLPPPRPSLALSFSFSSHPPCRHFSHRHRLELP
jgi:hypothetical protein